MKISRRNFTFFFAGTIVFSSVAAKESQRQAISAMRIPIESERRFRHFSERWIPYGTTLSVSAQYHLDIKVSVRSISGIPIIGDLVVLQNDTFERQGNRALIASRALISSNKPLNLSLMLPDLQEAPLDLEEYMMGVAGYNLFLTIGSEVYAARLYLGKELVHMISSHSQNNNHKICRNTVGKIFSTFNSAECSQEIFINSSPGSKSLSADITLLVS